MATQRKDHPRSSQSTKCSLCGIELPLELMVPDGGQACADIRWYCKDAKSCTERWTARPGATPDPIPADDPPPAELLGITNEA